jgi:hypothetical protein
LPPNTTSWPKSWKSKRRRRTAKPGPGAARGSWRNG